MLGYPYAVGDRIAKAMPPLIMGRDTPLAACLELTPGMEEGYKMAADLRKTDGLEQVHDGAEVLYAIWPNFDPGEAAGVPALLAAARRALYAKAFELSLRQDRSRDTQLRYVEAVHASVIPLPINSGSALNRRRHSASLSTSLSQRVRNSVPCVAS